MKKYQIIYADPPWQYDNKKTGGSLTSGACQKYVTMTTDSICSLPIYDIADDNSVLFLWTTTNFKFDAYRVMNSWGFAYKTTIYWKKTRFGMGYWYRGSVEELLVGIHGKIKPFRCQKANFIQTKALKHSEKPEEFRVMIEESTKCLTSRIELFARKKTPGWDVWGNEIESDIVLETSL